MNTEAIKDRIRKLFRLARDKGASEAEAASAMAMASKLMLQYNIEHVGEEREEEAIIGNWMGVNRGDDWERIIAAAIADLFNCKSICNRVGDQQFAGYAANIAACEETYIWVCEQVETLYKEGLRAFKKRLGGLDKTTRSEFRKTFKHACSVRIFRRVAEIKMANRGDIPSHLALVVVDKALAAATDAVSGMKERHKEVAIRKTGFGTGAGLMAGDNVRLQPNVEKST